MVKALETTLSPMLGIGLMTFAMLILPISDGIVKLLSDEYPILFLNGARYFAGAVTFVPIALVMLRNYQFPTNQIFSLSTRTILHVCAVSLYFLAIARVPIADALGAYFVAPLVASVLAVILLNERITRSQAVALFVGFGGALIVVRPGASINVGMLYALTSGVVFGIFLVSTRKTSQKVPALAALGFQFVLGTLLLLPVVIYFWKPVELWDLYLIGVAGVLWAIGHFAIIQAFKRAATSTLSPFIYLEILGGAAVGYFMFNNIPSVITIIGIALVAFSGLLVQRTTSAVAVT